MTGAATPSNGGYSIFFPATAARIAGTMLMVMMAVVALAQEKQLVQIKTFDQQLQPMKNLEVSINGGAFIAIGSKGSAMAELAGTDLPVKTIRIKSEQLEPASWNYSKGVLEIILRKKNYHVTRLLINTTEGKPARDTKFTFQGQKTLTLTTNNEGRVELPLALGEKINSADQFSVSDYNVIGIRTSDQENVLTIEPVKIVTPEQTTPVVTQATPSNKPVTGKEYFKNFNLSKLDSIQSLTVFYAIFKNYNLKGLSEEGKKKVDAKFNQLVAQLQDSIIHNENLFMGRITDSSFVREDIRNLLNQATLESQTLQTQRTDFDEKIKVINEKLARGITNLNADTRAKLLSDLELLEQLLTENESRFYKNQNDYRQIINSLKEKYFDINSLETRLSESEAKRLEEQRLFRERLIGISAIVLAFVILTVLLISFSNRLRKQKKELQVANAEVKRINENLEGIVRERTRLLEEANRELDTFLYRASHDLRSPVCSIIGLCNIALLLSDGESRELVQRVATTTEGMDRLLKKLAIISEINQPTGYDSITLLDLAERVAQKFSKTIRELGIQFHLDCPADLVLFSYPNLIDVILTNLIENAVLYSVMRDPVHARIEVTATIRDGKLQLVVNDNGTGIDPAIQHRVFDMFFKGHVDAKGSGLGLYIVQRSVQALEGSIRVESELNRYTRFIATLPLNLVEAREKEAAMVN